MSNLLNWVSENWVVLVSVWSAVCIIVDAISGWVNSEKFDSVWTKIKNVVKSIINLNPFSSKK